MSADLLHTPSARLRLGIGTADITPPADAYHRNWGAARHDAAEGIHRPLRATAALLSPEEGGAEHALVGVDLGWLRTREMQQLLERLADATGIDPERLVVSFSHTHSAINLDLTRASEAGGQHIGPYLEALPGRLARAVAAARQAARTVDLSYGRGCCHLAMNRDHRDATRNIATCGPNPDATADAEVRVARIADTEGRPVASVVNYACHPTTLAWENRLISPDYVGPMRALVEEATGVPCLFLLGPCGDLGPRDGFVGDLQVVERNGRQLGHAAMQALESLPPPGTEMRYVGPVVSGATLGIWQHQPLAGEALAAARQFRSTRLSLDLPFREMPSRECLERELGEWRTREEAARDAVREPEARDCRARVERCRRAVRRLEELPADGRADYPVRLWQLGEGVLAMLGGEPYNLLQRALRQRFPGTPLLFAELCNEPYSYILPADRCGLGHYQDECSTLAPGSLEAIIDAIAGQLAAWGCR